MGQKGETVGKIVTVVSPDGTEYSLGQLSDKLGVPYSTLYQRYRRYGADYLAICGLPEASEAAKGKPRPLRIRQKRKEQPGDTPRDVYEVEQPHLTMQHVTPVVTSLPMPETLPSTMQERWDVIVATMGATGMLSPTDLPVLETAFVALHLQELASRQLQMDGPIVYDAKGQAIPHPAVKMARDSAQTIMQCSKQLGWDVVTRIKNPIPEMPTNDPNDPARLLTDG